MYLEHQPIVERYARANSDNMGRVMIFILLTIQQALFRAVNDLEFIDAKVEQAFPSILFGFKGKAYYDILDQKAEVYGTCEEIIRDMGKTRHAADLIVARLMQVHGFGPAKSGFFAQLCYGLSACLDTHNVVRLGLGNPKRQPFGRSDRGDLGKVARRYNDIVDKCGTTEKLWNDWCRYVALNSKANHYYATPEHVSALHAQPFAA